jgi:hypothetical protein
MVKEFVSGCCGADVTEMGRCSAPDCGAVVERGFEVQTAYNGSFAEMMASIGVTDLTGISQTVKDNLADEVAMFA